jgi:Mn2+/Fe2+ NRAMP family transporter
LTQTTYFTESLGANFGFVILISVLIDIGAQINIWRIIAVSERQTQDVANMVVPGLGFFLAFLVVIGGLAFNIGNIAGTGLGMNVTFGISPEVGAGISGIIAIGIFLIREAGKAMDKFAQIMGIVMIVLTLYVMFTAAPPYGEAAFKSVVPDSIDMLAIVTLVGGTVGGYITFAGGHRLLDGGVKGVEALPEVTKSSVSAIGIASIMRILLFLAALGVVAKGLSLDPANPAASVFQLAAGTVGYKMFGVIMWAASITSVIGSAYTSVSFIRTFASVLNKRHREMIVAFIVVSTLIFVLMGKPVKVLILAGALNGLILPVSLGVMLIAAHKKQIVGDYRHPIWLTIFGAVIVVIMAYLGIDTMMEEIPKLLQ